MTRILVSAGFYCSLDNRVSHEEPSPDFYHLLWHDMSDWQLYAIYCNVFMNCPLHDHKETNSTIIAKKGKDFRKVNREERNHQHLLIFMLLIKS